MPQMNRNELSVLVEQELDTSELAS